MAQKLSVKKIVGITLSTVVAGVLVSAIFVGNYYANKFSSVLQSIFDDNNRNQTKVDYEGVDSQYYKSSYSDRADLLKDEEALAKTTCDEGFTVLESGNIPYDTNTTKVSLFSKSSVNFIFGGTGSGTAESKVNLKDAFTEGGFSVNEDLWNLYSTGSGKKYSRGSGSINYGDSDDYAINECPLSVVTSNDNVLKSFDTYDTGVFVLSRTGGEGNDLARGMYDYVDTSKDKNSGKHPDAIGDKAKSYLEPDSIELQVMKYINDNFKDFILVVNCDNAIELGWTSQFNNLSTIINVPGTGDSGLTALPDILSGKVIASGKLTDTYAYDAFSSPAMQNMGDYQYLVDGNQVPNNKGNKSFNGLYYTSYSEGIYVGYRYYETRYEDCVLGRGNASQLASWENDNSTKLGLSSWDYSKEVEYPFGYGDSLAKFSWTDFKVTQTGDSFTATTIVTNTSSYSGKDVVELYAQTPYGEYEKANLVEKSAVDLIGFAKTNELKPGESETVSINFNKEDLKSYDYKNAKTYILSKGQYYFTAGKDAHAAINNILRAKGYSSLTPSPSEEVAGDASLVSTSFSVSNTDSSSYSHDSATGTEVTNLFDFANLSTYEEHKDLTRQDWKNTYPKIEGNVSTTVSNHSERVNGTDKNGNPVGYQYTKALTTDSEIYKQVESNESLNPEFTSAEDIKWSQSSELQLIDQRGADITDERWNELVSKMSLSEAASLVEKGGYQTISMDCINKPKTFDTDGPAGFNAVSGHKSLGFNFPCDLLIAQTWNIDIAQKIGEFFGEEGLRLGISGWYGPATNIHRTPFGGRNFEYYSEDPVLSYSMSKRELNGAAKKGVYGYLKHFALNDQENHREKETGICTFSNEQGMREIYLRAFEGAIKDNEVDMEYYDIKMNDDGTIYKNSEGNDSFTKKTKKMPACTGIMSSFNRLGGIWAGGCYPLITSLLQKEWGFKGVVCTDYYHDWFMSTNQTIKAGGSLILDPQSCYYSVSSDNKEEQYYLREACKNLLYTVTNSNAMNNYVHGVKEIAAFPTYKKIVISIEAVLGVGAAVLILNSIRIIYRNSHPKMKKKKEEGK